MATLESLGSSMESFIKEKVEIERFTYSELSQQLQTAYPGEKGFSARSLQRYCRAKGISKTSKIDDNMLDDVVAEAVSMDTVYFYAEWAGVQRCFTVLRWTCAVCTITEE
ncbi:uncharacterized protein [Dysidea avara]|uniref:uncharacterized protein n=1 Tax=Dysidea avara TaxID=196820 RepID=UPI0033250D8E